MPPKKKPLPLTIKEKSVLEFIEQFLQEQSVAPTYQEIKDHFGFASFNSVQRYLKQLQSKNYLHLPGDNQKRALQVLNPSTSLSNLLVDRISGPSVIQANNPLLLQLSKKETSPSLESPPGPAESLSLPLLGRVAAGSPIEAFEHNEFIDVPVSLVRNPTKTFALTVQGQSMIEDGILDGDVLLVQKQSYANNGETVVAMIDNQATVKKFYLHAKRINDVHSYPQTHTQVELRPANASMSSMWYPPPEVDIQGIVVGLMRRF